MPEDRPNIKTPITLRDRGLFFSLTFHLLGVLMSPVFVRRPKAGRGYFICCSAWPGTGEVEACWWLRVFRQVGRIAPEKCAVGESCRGAVTTRYPGRAEWSAGPTRMRTYPSRVCDDQAIRSRRASFIVVLPAVPGNWQSRKGSQTTAAPRELAWGQRLRSLVAIQLPAAAGFTEIVSRTLQK